MTAKHIFEEGIYLLNNVAVASNPLFRDEYNFKRFKESSQERLSALCDIIAYAFHDNQWELLVKMKSRADFIEFYKQKHENESIAEFTIPESAYIFSQEMANLQSGFVKHFNWLNKRVGGLFYRRYQKVLLGSESEMVLEVERLNKLVSRNPHRGEWAIRKVERLRNVVGRSSGDDYGKTSGGILSAIEDRLGMDKDDLEAYFTNLPALEIVSPISRYLRQLFKILSFFEVSNPL